MPPTTISVITVSGSNVVETILTQSSSTAITTQAQASEVIKSVLNSVPFDFDVTTHGIMSETVIAEIADDAAADLAAAGLLT